MLHAGFTELDCVAVTEFSSQCLRSRRTDPLMKNRIMHQAVTAMTLMTASLLPNEQRPSDIYGDRLRSVMRWSAANYLILLLFPGGGRMSQMS